MIFVLAHTTYIIVIYINHISCIYKSFKLVSHMSYISHKNYVSHMSYISHISYIISMSYVFRYFLNCLKSFNIA